ncbi:MAG: hypothetical protein ACOCX4_02330 [Planctomycetota bacterium]
MSIDFTPSRWDDVREAHTRWWAGELKRPLIHARGPVRTPDRDAPALPAGTSGFHAFYPLETPEADIVDRWDYDLSCQSWIADGFPCIWPNFGPGVIAAFLGGRLEGNGRTVWFHPPEGGEDREADAIRFDTFDEENVWFRRIANLYREGLARWEGLVQLGMTDLGGNLDILSSFRPSERLLFDLYDCPDEVKRLTWEAHEMWWRHFDALNAILQPTNPGYTAWTPIFSADPYYMLQCDFCYMIGPDMFDEFVKPELAASCEKLTNPFYHLDGPGQLPHLDSLLQIEALKGVQWVPGDGAKPYTEWPEVYRKIRDAGKRIQLFGNLDTLDTVAGQLGAAEGIILICWGELDPAETDAVLRKWS